MIHISPAPFPSISVTHTLPVHFWGPASEVQPQSSLKKANAALTLASCMIMSAACISINIQSCLDLNDLHELCNRQVTSIWDWQFRIYHQTVCTCGVTKPWWTEHCGNTMPPSRHLDRHWRGPLDSGRYHEWRTWSVGGSVAQEKVAPHATASSWLRMNHYQRNLAYCIFVRTGHSSDVGCSSDELLAWWRGLGRTCWMCLVECSGPASQEVFAAVRDVWFPVTM